ncbi:MAG TPA: Hsp70 family protein [Pirellulaceae bacterium]|nr:Hsp70 family protein [Pirellulaceae bacterium]
MSAAFGNLVGIDLGTTMSVIAHVDATGRAVTLPNREGDSLTPSAVYLDGNDAIVGKAAKLAAAHHPGKVATYVKRRIGTGRFGREIDGRLVRPETLSAIILKKLRNDAERRIGPIDKVVITVPAFFDDARRRATEAAGRIAGLDVLGIVNEPTAAGLAYCLQDRIAESSSRSASPIGGRPFTGLVYDLGGGTFDVTLVRLSERGFTTLATDGEVRLGGKDWDDVIIDLVGAEFLARHEVDPRRDEAWVEGMAGQVEATKVLLSQLPSAPIEFTYRERTLRTTLDRSRFEQASRDLLTRTRLVTRLVAEEQAKVPWSEIDKVLLVGGSTRMPMVRQMLLEATGKEPDDSLDPDQVVAHGAALYARLLASQVEVRETGSTGERGRLSEIEVIDVNSHSLGVVVLDRKTGKRLNHVLIPKNSPLPIAASKVFALPKEGQRQVRVTVLEGEAPEAEANIVVGECRVRDLPEGLPSLAPIQVRLSYGSSGKVNVMALDMTSGSVAQADLEPGRGMTDDEIAREAEFVGKLVIR